MDASGTQGPEADSYTVLCGWDKIQAQRWPHEVQKWAVYDEEARQKWGRDFVVTHEQEGYFISPFTRVSDSPLSLDRIPRVGSSVRLRAPPQLAPMRMRERLQGAERTQIYVVKAIQGARFELHQPHRDITVTAFPDELDSLSVGGAVEGCPSGPLKLGEYESVEEFACRSYVFSKIRQEPVWKQTGGMRREPSPAEVRKGFRLDPVDCLYKDFAGFVAAHGQESERRARKLWAIATEVRADEGLQPLTFKEFAEKYGAEAEWRWRAAGPVEL